MLYSVFLKQCALSSVGRAAPLHGEGQEFKSLRAHKNISMLKRLECIISGRVQKVMFRDFTTRKARSLGIVGMVQNRKDGTVYVVAQGEEDKLNKLLFFLNKGSIFSRVKDVKVEWKPPVSDFSSFDIVYSDSIWDRL